MCVSQSRLAFVILCSLAFLSRCVAAIDMASAMARAEGYDIQMHTTYTDDNYLVAAHRIRSRSGSRSTHQSPAPVVFLMHGLFNSGADWLVFGPRYSAGYLFADAGYDVWLGNARGTRDSRGHRTLDADRDPLYWDFSFHEIGRYDVPALVEMALRLTNTSTLHFVGFSQGGTVFFVALAERPEFAGRIRSMHAIAPGMYLGHLEVVPRLVIDNLETIQLLLHDLQIVEISRHRPILRQLVHPIYALCADGTIVQELCIIIFFAGIRTVSPPLSLGYAANLMRITPASISPRQLAHFGQIVRSGRFQRYDWGAEENRRRYGAAVTEPPEYEFGNTTVPVFAMYGGDDDVVSAVGMRTLCRKLGKRSVRQAVVVKGFNHYDFIYSRYARDAVYRKIIANWRSMDGR